MITHDPCVCVQSAEKNCANTDPAKTESQDGGVCVNSHTLFELVLSSCCCIVASQSASRSVSIGQQSTSTLLAQCEVVDNA